MRIVKFGHACVRIEPGDAGGAALVVDPGAFTDREAVDGATAVLVTHEHPDHLDVDNLRATSAPVYTIAAVADQIAEQAPDVRERVTVVSGGEQLDVGVAVRVVGEWHAVIHEDLPRFHNCGYVVEADGRKVYHPGDSFTVPDEAVDVLCLPVAAPWLKMSEAVDFGREVGAARNVAIHDAVASDIGLGILDTQVGALLGARDLDYTRLRAGQELPPA